MLESSKSWYSCSCNRFWTFLVVATFGTTDCFPTEVIGEIIGFETATTKKIYIYIYKFSGNFCQTLWGNFLTWNWFHIFFLNVLKHISFEEKTSWTRACDFTGRESISLKKISDSWTQGPRHRNFFFKWYLLPCLLGLVIFTLMVLKLFLRAESLAC